MVTQKVAIVLGLGRMGCLHVQALRKLGCPRIFGFDPYLKFKGKDGPPGVELVDSLVAGPGFLPELAVIASTGPSHLDNLRALLEACPIRFVLCEKPLAGSVEDGLAMQDLCAEKGVRLAVNFIRRYTPAYQDIVGFARAKDLMGPFVSMAVTCGAGGMACVGIHYIDLGRYLFASEAVSVSAFSRDLHLPVTRGSQFEDPGMYAVVSFAGGQRMFLDFSDDFGLAQHVEICAEQGRVFVDEETCEIRVRFRAPAKRPRTLRYYGEPLEDHPFSGRHPMQLIDPAMVALRNLSDTSQPILATADDGIAALEIYTAMRISADNNGTPVPLPLTTAQRTNRYSIT
jgi:myo-inositol 2-dehydrogenase / D-chiro-inositol 1-dehydrogenase